MFTYPKYPPKDYLLKHVPRLQTDSSQFTPEAEPRVTQGTLGIFCDPIEYGEGETPEKLEIKPFSPPILDHLTKLERASWVPNPGQDDYLLHHIYKKYNVKFDTYNPAFRHMEKVFNRSYKYELVCLEEQRLQRLRDKCNKEETMSQNIFESVAKKEHERAHPPMKVLGCRAPPPFWWKSYDDDDDDESLKKPIETQPTEEVIPKTTPTRWAKEPCLTAVVVDDHCRRKFDMQRVGQLFKTEACNFYYTNYPLPDIKFHTKKFQ